MVKAQLLLTAAAVAVVGAFSPNAPQTVRMTKLRKEKMLIRSDPADRHISERSVERKIEE